MGMLFHSQAVHYLQTRFNQEFAPGEFPPGRGLPFWQSDDPLACEFRDALDSSTRHKAPAFGSITLEYLDLSISDSYDGNAPFPDPSFGKSYKRWIVFWKRFRKHYGLVYSTLTDEMLSVLNQAPKDRDVVGLLFEAIEARHDDEIGPGVTYEDLSQGKFKKLTIVTRPWDKIRD